MNRYQNIVLLVADSLRYDNTWGRTRKPLPRLQQHSYNYHQAYSAGCWTLPATASIFTGLMPHEHQATTRTRKGLARHYPILMEQLRELGFGTYQLTANSVTTDIFGLDRGFQVTEKVWQWLDSSKIPALNFFLLLSKRRMRKKVIKGDFITGKMTQDVKAGQAWLYSFCQMQLNRAEEIIKWRARQNKRTFLFINLMETHFPYHIGNRFKALSRNTLDKLEEIRSMFHLVNQTWLTSGKRLIKPDMLRLLRERQLRAWQRIAPKIDRFFQEITAAYPETLFIFLSDHGDNFGDENWLYHFGNVTEAGNRVPLIISTPDTDEGHDINFPFSTRQLYDIILDSACAPIGSINLEDYYEIPPCIQSYWYDLKGKTLPQFQHDQFAFVHANHRYVKQPDTWSFFNIAQHNSAAVQEEVFPGNPIYDLGFTTTEKEHLQRKLAGFQSFSESIS